MENEENQEEQDIQNETAYEESSCQYCGLAMYKHDGSGLCPGGTEEFGGRR